MPIRPSALPSTRCNKELDAMSVEMDSMFEKPCTPVEENVNYWNENFEILRQARLDDFPHSLPKILCGSQYCKAEIPTAYESQWEKLCRTPVKEEFVEMTRLMKYAKIVWTRLQDMSLTDMKSLPPEKFKKQYTCSDSPIRKWKDVDSWLKTLCRWWYERATIISKDYEKYFDYAYQGNSYTNAILTAGGAARLCSDAREYAIKGVLGKHQHPTVEELSGTSSKTVECQKPNSDKKSKAKSKPK
jgi:hypothetical protein